MRIADTEASILISEVGSAVLSASGIQVDPLCWLEADIVESEDLGLWMRIDRGDLQRVLLLRWEYILAIDLPSGTGKVIGMRI